MEAAVWTAWSGGECGDDDRDGNDGHADEQRYNAAWGKAAHRNLLEFQIGGLAPSFTPVVHRWL